MSIRIPLFALVAVFAATGFAQDSLFYTNGTVIVGQVEEIGLDVIKYRTNSNGDQVLIEVDKHDISKVKLKDGQTYTITPIRTEVPHSAAFLGRKHALSLDVIAPALNHVTIGYERLLGPRISLVVKAGYIGLWNEGPGNEDRENSDGWLLAAGVKFILPRSAEGLTPAGDAHPLAGWYLSPELMFSAWTTTYYYIPQSYPPYYQPLPPVETKTNYTSPALVLIIGREFFLGEHFTFDISGGVGYGKQQRAGQSAGVGAYQQTVFQQYSFSHAFLGDTSPLVVTGGLRFGYVF